MADSNEPTSTSPVEPSAPVAPPPTPETPPAATPMQPGSNHNVFAIVALVTGIVAVVGGWVPFFGFVLGAAAIVFAILAFRKHQKKPFAVTGLVTGIVAVGWNVLISTFFLIGLLWAPAAIKASEAASNALSSVNASDQAAIDAQKDFKKGDTAVFDMYKVKVNSVQTNYTPSDGDTASDGDQLVLVNMTVTNVGDMSMPVDSYLFEMLDDADGSVAKDASFVQGPNPIEEGDLAKGASITGDVVYEVSANAKTMKLQYTTYAYDKNYKYETLTYTLVVQ